MAKRASNTKKRSPKPSASEPRWRWYYKLQLVSIGGDSERSYILEYLALLVRSGMDMADALASIRKELRNKALSYKLYEVQRDVESGMPLSDAFEASGLFRPDVVSLIRVGEVSGRLPENLEAIVEQQENARRFRSQIQSASLYPVFVLGVTGGVGVAIAWFILPQLATVFTSLDMDLPFVTEIVIALGLFLSDYGNIVIPTAFAVMIVLLYLVFFFPKTKIIGQWILFGTPGIRRLIREVEISRFGTVLGSLLQAGLPIDEALVALRRSTSFYRYKRLYDATHAAILGGETFDHLFDTYKHSRALIPAPIQQMVVAGERSGELPGSLMQVGEVYKQKTELTTKNLSVILEPILLVIVWIGVVIVALSVILPVYNLVGGVTEQPGVPGAQRSTQTPIESVPEQEVQEPEAVLEEPDPGIQDQTAAQERVRVVSPIGTLNAREAPGTDQPILGQFVNGQELLVVDQAVDEGWSLVQSDVLTGWVSDLYLEPIGDAQGV